MAGLSCEGKRQLTSKQILNFAIAEQSALTLSNMDSERVLLCDTYCACWQYRDRGESVPSIRFLQESKGSS